MEKMENYLTETARRNIPNSEFGLPEERKYPLNTEAHVKSAIRLFGHCPENKRAELAQRIRLAAKKYDIKIKDDSVLGKYLSEATTEYDSTIDARSHITTVNRFMSKIIVELEKRSTYHDASKLEEPEKSCYDKYIPLLKEAKYGTPEYLEIRKNMEKEGLKHHYEANRHHPEHFKDGINDMTLVDIVEMFIDWQAASQRSDTGFKEGLKSNRKRYGINEQLYRIFLNTDKEYFNN